MCCVSTLRLIIYHLYFIVKNTIQTDYMTLYTSSKREHLYNWRLLKLDNLVSKSFI